MQLIVEKAMRDVGLQGDFEDGWKRTLVDAAGNAVDNKYNFQDMRDATAQAILDALTNVNVIGTLSTGNVQGVQAKSGGNSQINISPNPTTGSALAFPAARVGDTVIIDNAIFLQWIITISAAVNALSSGSVPIVPVIVDGKITSGSTNVAIGDSNVQIGN